MHGQHPEERVAEAACGYWHRRGLPTEPDQVLVAPGAPLLLLSLLAATGGGRDVLLPRPCADWYGPQARLLGSPVHRVPVPAECGGVPDPFALLETVHRARAAGGAPGVLVLSVADEPTGTAVPPELLHEVCEAAAGEHLLLVSDESWRDTSHRLHDTITVSPAEMLHTATGDTDCVVVLLRLDAALLAPDLPVGIARLPAAGQGRTLAGTARAALEALNARLPEVAARAATEALGEPASLRERAARVAREHGRRAAVVQRAVTAAGGLCRPPHLSRSLYLDLEPLRPVLAARGIGDSATLEAALVLRLGAAARGGHRFGDDPGALRAALSTEARHPAAAEVDGTVPSGRPGSDDPSGAQQAAALTDLLAPGAGEAAHGFAGDAGSGAGV